MSTTPIFKGRETYTYSGKAIFPELSRDKKEGELSLKLFISPTSSFVNGDIQVDRTMNIKLGNSLVDLSNPTEHFKSVATLNSLKWNNTWEKYEYTYSGVFMGPNAEEVVGKVSNGAYEKNNERWELNNKGSFGAFGGKRQ